MHECKGCLSCITEFINWEDTTLFWDEPMTTPTPDPPESRPIPPGETIREAAQERGITAAQLAYNLGQTFTETLALLSGDTVIDSRMAEKLEDVLDIRASMWLGLERDYRVALAHQPTQTDEP